MVMVGKQGVRNNTMTQEEQSLEAMSYAICQ